MTDNQHDQLPMAASPAAAQVNDTADFEFSDGESTTDGAESIEDPAVRSAAQKRRRGSRGGRNRKKPAGSAPGGLDGDGDDADDPGDTDDEPMEAGDPFETASSVERADPELPELPKRLAEGRASVAAAERALVRKPQIGDTRPAPPVAPAAAKPAQPRGDRNRQRADKPKVERQAQP
ncbi:MAG: hypothetical protein M3P52_07140, partial [Actinomycetota bacterium]|nr:hypothetical protein [Actinomycetota bacterium]